MEPIYKQRCGSLFCFILWHHQNSQVDLFAKSEIFTCVYVVGDPTRGVWGYAPRGNFEKQKQLGRVSLYSEQKCGATLNWNPPSCVETPRHQSAVSICEHMQLSLNAGSAQVVEASTNRTRIKLYHERQVMKDLCLTSKESYSQRASRMNAQLQTSIKYFIH